MGATLVGKLALELGGKLALQLGDKLEPAVLEARVEPDNA